MRANGLAELDALTLQATMDLCASVKPSNLQPISRGVRKTICHGPVEGSTVVQSAVMPPRHNVVSKWVSYMSPNESHHHFVYHFVLESPAQHSKNAALPRLSRYLQTSDICSYDSDAANGGLHFVWFEQYICLMLEPL